MSYWNDKERIYYEHKENKPTITSKYFYSIGDKFFAIHKIFLTFLTVFCLFYSVYRIATLQNFSQHFIYYFLLIIAELLLLSFYFYLQFCEIFVWMNFKVAKILLAIFFGIPLFLLCCFTIMVCGGRVFDAANDPLSLLLGEVVMAGIIPSISFYIFRSSVAF